MTSLTPMDRADEVSWEAFKEGITNGVLTLIPAIGGLQLALRNAKFAKYTNWQSRTALVIMPSLFVFAWTSEHKLFHRMQQMANETEHTMETARWAEEKHERERANRASVNGIVDDRMATEARLTELYRQGVETSGVRIVKGELGIHHRIANFWQENPFKVLAFLGVPVVGGIYYGRSGKQHLQASMKIMQTRVMGQFSVITLLLGLMGFKEYMDQNGKFITEAEANARVEEMHRVREELKERLVQERALQERMDRLRSEAAAADAASGHSLPHGEKKGKKTKKRAHAAENVIVVEQESDVESSA